MEVRQYIRPDVAVSAIAHLSILALVMLFTEVHPFARGSEPIAVDLVTPEQVEQRADPTPTPTPQSPAFDLPSSDPPSSTPMPPGTPASSAAASQAPSPAASQATAAPPQRSAARPDRQQAAAAQSRPPQPQPAERQQQPSQPQPPAQPQPPTPSASLGYVPPEPDVTVKYHVMLGLPEDMPPLGARSGGRSGERSGETSGEQSGQNNSGDFDATASTPVDIASDPITEFRRHLKTCSKLPASVAPSDNLTVKLRLVFTLDGRLATDPMVGGGSPNPKALDLLQSAIEGLKACQPYTMLPADRYREWKVLDLDLTPKDFSS